MFLWHFSYDGYQNSSKKKVMCTIFNWKVEESVWKQLQFESVICWVPLWTPSSCNLSSDNTAQCLFVPDSVYTWANSKLKELEVKPLIMSVT